MWMIEHADDLRAAAQERRNRGLPTGKQAAGWATKRADPEAGTFERVRAEIKARLRNHWADVLADYQAAAYPDRAIPF